MGQKLKISSDDTVVYKYLTISNASNKHNEDCEYSKPLHFMDFCKDIWLDDYGNTRTITAMYELQCGNPIQQYKYKSGRSKFHNIARVWDRKNNLKRYRISAKNDTRRNNIGWHSYIFNYY